VIEKEEDTIEVQKDINSMQGILIVFV